MAEKKQSFIEKNLPTLARKGNKKETKSGKKQKSIRETTQEGRRLRKKREEKAEAEPDKVSDISEVKGYKPTKLSLPYADLLPLDIKVALARRSVRFTFGAIIVGIIAVTVFAYIGTMASTAYSKQYLEKAKEDNNRQSAVNAKYAPLTSYLGNIERRIQMSGTVMSLLPPYDKTLSLVSSVGTQMGVSYTAVKIDSKESGTGGTKSAAPAPTPTSGTDSVCGPTNDPYNPNTKPVIGCLTVNGTVSSVDQMTAYQKALAATPYLADVYATNGGAATTGKPGATTPTTPTAATGVVTFTLTASIVSETAATGQTPAATGGKQ